MFRKSTLICLGVAMFAVSAVSQTVSIATASHNLAPKNKTSHSKTPKTTKSGRHSKTNLKKVSGFDVCSAYPQWVGGEMYSGSGAFTLPLWAGACNDVDFGEDDPIGTLSASCTANPYAGVQTTWRLEAVGGALATDNTGSGSVESVGDGTGGNAQDWNVPPPATVSTDPVAIPANATSADIQALADATCAATVPPRASLCAGQLRIKGEASTKNKYPGSSIDYNYASTTDFDFVGSTYLTKTQYTLSGLTETVNDGPNDDPNPNPNQAVTSVALSSYEVFTEITCQYVPSSINVIDGEVITGSGKFEKNAVKYVQNIEHDIEVETFAPNTVANPTNDFQNGDIFYMSQLTVDYWKGGYLDTPLL